MGSDVSISQFQETLKKQLMTDYPSLHVVEDHSLTIIRGSLFIYDSTRTRELDRYSIEIIIPKDYTRQLPLVREIGGRLPKILDRHFIPPTDIACLFFPDERYKYYPPGSTIIDFIRGPVESFFRSQTYFDLNGKWPYGERGHGLKGLIEFYSELLGTNDIIVIKKFLKYLSKEKIKGSWKCYCGSYKRLQDCHFSHLSKFKNKISRQQARNTLTFIEKYFDK
ncbi:MAG: hypothetical protein GF353_00640 [Candidatus Lokiarchaeota archaeon]|nr:hypothetical protein [Candidatus Lokiarchaeota archaeon]